MDGRGGKRTGAGRPAKQPGEGRVAMGFSCPPEMAEAIDRRWEELGFKNRSAYIKALVEADLAAARDGRHLVG